MQDFKENPLKAKKYYKQQLKESFNLNKNFKDNFLLSITSEFSDKCKGGHILQALKGILEVGINIIIRGKGTQKYQTYIEDLQTQYPNNLFIIEDTKENIIKMYEASDANIFLNKEDLSEELKFCMERACIPISISFKGLSDFNAIKEEGNAFIIKKISSWFVFEAVVRAKENYNFPYDWKNIQKACVAFIDK